MVRWRLWNWRRFVDKNEELKSRSSCSGGWRPPAIRNLKAVINLRLIAFRLQLKQHDAALKTLDALKAKDGRPLSRLRGEALLVRVIKRAQLMGSWRQLACFSGVERNDADENQ